MIWITLLARIAAGRDALQRGDDAPAAEHSVRVIGLVERAALNALKALVGASAFSRTAAGSEPPSVGRAGLPAADSKL